MNLVSSPPKSKQIADLLRAQILAGELPPGAPVDSVREQARRFGVSRQVIRSAFGTLSDEGLLIARVGHGTVVNPALKDPNAALRLGFYLHRDDLGNTFYNAAYLGAFDRLCAAGDSLVLLPRLPSATDRPGEVQCDATILTGAVDDAICQAFTAQGRPFVVLGNYVLDAAVHRVELSIRDFLGTVLHELAGRLAPVAFGAVLGPARLPSTQEFVSVLRHFSLEAGIRCHDSEIVYAESKYGDAEVAARWGRGAAWPDLVLCTLHSFLGVTQVLLERGTSRSRWPRLAVMVDDASFLPLPHPELAVATILISNRELGAAAAERLAQLTRRPAPVETVRFVPESVRIDYSAQA